MLRSFIELLGFWGSVYQTHQCERRFLEFSSGVPFAQWMHVVTRLKAELTARPDVGEVAQADDDDVWLQPSEAAAAAAWAAAPAEVAQCEVCVSEERAAVSADL